MTIDRSPETNRDRLPWLALSALFTAGLVTVLTESLPAGLLPQMSAGLDVTASAAGQLLTIYAVGTAAAALPLTIATATWGRRSVLLIAVAAFVLANTATALSTAFLLTLVVRFVAGLAAGLIWSTIGGYAQSLVSPALQGRAVSIATAGTPVALALGIPAGTLLGTFGGWRVAFALISALAIVLLVVIALRLPNTAGTPRSRQLPMPSVLRAPGVRPVLVVVGLFALGHNALYIYIAPLLRAHRLVGQTEWVLLTFGVASVIGIVVVARGISRHLRRLTLTALVLLAAVALALGAPALNGPVLYVIAAVWGLGYGGTPALFLTASGHAGGAGAGVAQAMMVTLWNAGIALAGLLGGLALVGPGAFSLGGLGFVLAAAAFVVAVRSRANGFPSAAGL